MSTSIPTTMRGVLIEAKGGPEVLQYKTDLKVPEPKEGQILIKNEYAAINFIDTYFRTGLYPSPLPEVLGREGAGVVVALGPSSGDYYGMKVGDRVAWLGGGGYAEYSAVGAVNVFKIPDEVSFETAAASILQGLTAVTLIEEAHKVTKGQWVLVHAASGGMGQWLCQLLRNVGARVIGTASTKEKLDQAVQHGVEFPINYAEVEDWPAEVKKITGGEGVHVVFDGVGKSTFDGSLESLRRKGSMVSFGNASGAVPPLTIARLAPKNIKLLRPQLYAYIATREEFDHYAHDLFENLKGDFYVGIHKTYGLDEIKQAHEDLEGRKTMGKLVIKI